MKDHSREPLNFLNVIRFIYRWLYYFIGICFSAVVLAYILASPLFTDPVYKSSTSFYPISENSLSTELLRDFSPGDKDYLDYGSEEQVESYLEILRSNRIQNYLLNKFNLMKHYGIDKDGEKPFVKFKNRFKKNFEFRKTQFMALEVRVFDKEPKQAAIMANEVVNALDSFVKETKHERASKTVALVKKKYRQQKKRYNKIADSVQKLSKKGLVQFESQSEALTESLGEAQLSERTSLVNDIKEKLSTVGKYGPIYYSLTEEMVYITEKITNLHTKYQKIQADAEGNLPKLYVLDKAQVNREEAKPKKLLIMVLALIGSFIITFVFLNIYEKWAYIMETVAKDE